MPASAIVPPSIQTAAEAAAIAQSPARRSTFSCALPAPGRSGSRTSVSSSPAPTAVMYGPTWKSSMRDDALAVGAADHDLRLERRADRRQVLGRVGLAERAADRAAVAHDRVGDHLLGVAEEREVLARAGRTSAGRRAGSARRSGSRRPPRGCRRARARSLMSIRCSGFASRSFIIGSRLWPPAMMRASGPSRWSDAIAPSTLVARSYSNAAGVCNVLRSSGTLSASGAACAARRCRRAARTAPARRCR